MSEEKLDRIDQRLTELVTITGNLVTAVTKLTQQAEIHTEQISQLTRQQKAMTNQLADIARVVIDTSKKQDEMKRDTDRRVSAIEEKISI